MLSRKGVFLIVGGSLVVLFGAVANVILSWETGVHPVFFLTLCNSSDTDCINNMQRLNHLDALGNHLTALFSLIDGSLVPLALATLGLGLASLWRPHYAAGRQWYRWFAVLGLTCMVLSTLKTVAQILIAQEQARLGFPSGMETDLIMLWLLRPTLWASLVGFLMVLWGSFLRQNPDDGSHLVPL